MKSAATRTPAPPIADGVFRILDGAWLAMLLALPFVLTLRALQTDLCGDLSVTFNTGDKSSHTVLLLGAGCWVVALALFWVFGWVYSRHSWAVTGGAVLLGLIVHFLLIVLVYVILHPHTRTPHLQLAALVVQVSTMLPAVLIVAVPCRRLIASAFGTEIRRAKAAQPRNGQTNSQGQFTFNKRQPGRKAEVQVRRAAPQPAPTPHAVLPPAGFAIIKPMPGVEGTVPIPRNVILKSIPEALELLPVGKPVNVPLACLVPQLQRPVAWLTWQQIAGSAGAAADDPLSSRWVRIPAQHFAQQIPREHYAAYRKQHPPLPWTALPVVPQEDQFEQPALTER